MTDEVVIPLRLALRYTPPTLVLEFSTDASGTKLYHYRMRLKNLNHATVSPIPSSARARSFPSPPLCIPVSPRYPSPPQTGHHCFGADARTAQDPAAVREMLVKQHPRYLDNPRIKAAQATSRRA